MNEFEKINCTTIYTYTQNNKYLRNQKTCNIPYHFDFKINYSFIQTHENNAC